MDELKAFEILELNTNASKEEIKEAYARLSKIYHPEENPEKFQELHEAYTFLLRSQRRKKATTVQVEPSNFDSINEKEETNLNEVKQESTLDFDQAENQAILEEIEQNKLLIHQAVIEFSILLKPEYCNKNKLFKDFFRNQAYQKIIRDSNFVYELARLLNNTQLKKAIYDYIIDFYRLRGENYQYLDPEYQMLYEVLDHKRGMKAKAKDQITTASIPFIILMTSLRSLRMNATQEVFMPILIGVIALTLLIFAVYKLYQYLYERYSNLKAQALSALATIVFHIIVIILDAYQYVFVDSELGMSFAVGFILLALVWLLGIFIATLFKRLRRK